MFVQRQDLLSTVQVPDLHRTICQGEGGGGGGGGGGGERGEGGRESLEELFAGGQSEMARLQNDNSSFQKGNHKVQDTLS